MLKIQTKDFSDYLTKQQIKFVRTYKGDIERTQTGVVAAFPTSFITIGFDLTFIALNEVAEEIQQLVLSANVILLEFTYGGTNYKGQFSATTNSEVELRDKDERHKQLTLSVVSDGTSILKSDGTALKVYDTNTSTILVNNCSFGKVYTFENNGVHYYMSGAHVPLADETTALNSILVLGDIILTRAP